MPSAHNVVPFQRASRPTTPALSWLADEESAPEAEHIGKVHPGPRSVWSYTVCNEIARGGMASVYFGWALSASGIRRPVALKRIRAGLPNASELEAALRSEALLGCHIRHPNVVPVLDLVEIGGVTFLVMEYVMGKTLAGLLEGCASLPVATSVAIVSGALRGLHAAHTATDSEGRALHVIHRDVSPQNILVGRDGIARVLDFGVAKTCDSEPTRIGHVKGKIGYFAPEQFFQEPLDARTDVFAAGIVLWEALAGRRLFPRSDPLEDVADLAIHQLRSVSDFNPRVPKRLAALLARALHPSRERRFDTAEQFAEAIEEIVRPSSPSEVARCLASHRVHGSDRRAPPPRPGSAEKRVGSAPPKRVNVTTPRPVVASDDDEVTAHRDPVPGRAALDSQDVTVLLPPPIALRAREPGPPRSPKIAALGSAEPMPRPRPSGTERRAETAPAALKGVATAIGRSRLRTLGLGAASLALLLIIAAGGAALGSRQATAAWAHRLWSNLGSVIHPLPRDAGAAAATNRLPARPSPMLRELGTRDAAPVEPAPPLDPRGAVSPEEVVVAVPDPVVQKRRPTPPAPIHTPRAKPGLGARSKGSPRCRPPYRYDGTGIKRMKLECL